MGGRKYVVLALLLAILMMSWICSAADFEIFPDKDSYYPNQDVYLVVSGPVDSGFVVQVLNPTGSIVSEKSGRTTSSGNAYLPYSGFSSSGTYEVRLIVDGNVKAVSSFSVAAAGATTTTPTTPTTMLQSTITVTTSFISPTTPTTTVVTTGGGGVETTPPDPVRTTLFDFTNVTLPPSSDEPIVDLFDVRSEKEGFGLSENPTFEVATDDLKMLSVKAKTAPEVILKDAGDNVIKVKPRIEADGNDYTIELPTKKSIQPGRYKLVVELSGERKELWFSWGLVSVNTKKSMYHPNETAEIIMVVLNSGGYPVSGAEVELEVRSPAGVSEYYSTSEGSIVEVLKGVYAANYSSTWASGDYTMYVSAFSDGVMSSLRSSFTVKEFYEFDILRDIPAVIDPAAGLLQSRIRVVAYVNASSFTLRERLPREFEIVDEGGAFVSSTSEEMVLEWTNLNNNSVVSYSAQLPLIWPYLYELGPAEIVYDSATFTEARPWLLAVDPTVRSRLILFWNGTTNAPSGWTCLSCNSSTPFYNKLPRGNSTYGGTGGGTSHTHTITKVSHTNGATSARRTGGTTINGPITAHQHAVTSPSVVNASNLPLYKNIKVIAYNNGVPTMIPKGAIAIFNTSSLPSGWSRYSAQDGYFLRGANNLSTGGSNTHTHATSYTLAATADLTLFRSGGTTTVATDTHTHTVSGTSSNVDKRPPYVNVVLAIATANTTIPGGSSGMIAMFNATPPSNWVIMSASGGAFAGRFLVGNASYGGTGGISNHTHANLVTTSGVPVGTVVGATGGTTVPIGSNAHTHSVNVSFSNNANLPPFINVIFAMMKVKVATNSSSYLIADRVNITGYGWGSGSTVTLKIMNPSNVSVSGYPKNVTADSNGKIQDYWTIPVGSAAGTYSLLAFRPSAPSTNDTVYFTVTVPTLQTDKPSYLRTQTVYLSGGGYKPNAKVTLIIRDPTNDPISGYPKNVTSNSSGGISDSWTIPAGQALGVYSVNATDTANRTRTKATSFEIATAIIQGDKLTYSQGQTVSISGYNWDAASKVTINITNPSGVRIYGPKNLTANATGWVKDSWNITYNATTGNYKINAFEPSNPTKADEYPFTVTVRPVTVAANYSWYKRTDNVTIRGTGFKPADKVTVYLRKVGGSSVSGYPKNVTANSSGGIKDYWVVPAAQALGNYTVNATDFAYKNLKNSTLFELVVQKIYTDESAYKSGEIVYITGYYWDRSSKVTLYLRNSSGSLKTGYPKNVTASSNGVISDSWTAQPGSGFGAENYTLFARQAATASKNSTAKFSVTKVATLTTDKNFYFPKQNVSITGSYYIPSGLVKLWVTYVASGGTAIGYPKTLTATASGTISHKWNVSSYCPGVYRVSSEDQTYPLLLKANKTFNITYRDWTSRTCTQVWGANCGVTPPDADNTFDACATGTGADESVMNIYVNATKVTAGSKVSVTCQFDPYGTSDEVYVYYYNSTGWKALYSGSATGAVNYNLTVSATMDNVIGVHWFRCIIDYDGEGDNCANVGTWYDNDDINVSVWQAPASCITFDATPPKVLNVSATPNPQKLGRSVLIKANVSDANNVSSVKARVTLTNGTIRSLTMTDPNKDKFYNVSFSETAKVGVYNVTIWANDTWSNINSTQKTNFTIQYDTLAVQTNKPSYIRGETVSVSGTGFNANVKVTMNIRNSSGSSVSGYPKNVTSNSTGGITDSWVIPGGQRLGTYNVSAFDTTAPTRKAYVTFDVVTAVIQGDKSTYSQGQTVGISGYNWDAASKVTINITNPSGVRIYGPKNLTANATGWVKDSWNITYNATVGNYEINAFEPSNPSKADDFSFTVTQRQVSVLVNYTWYKRTDNVTIRGTGFKPSDKVTVDVRLVGGSSVSGYPKNVTANSSGGIKTYWVVPAAQAFGNYSVNATDFSYKNLKNSTRFELVVQKVYTDKSSYKSGETVYITGYYWDRSSKVTLYLRNSSGSLKTGYPKNVTASSNGVISDSWTAQPGSGFGAENYTLFARQAAAASKNSTAKFSVTKVATLNTDKTFYFPKQNVNITGSYYIPSGLVKLWVTYVASGGAAIGYPKTVSATSSGNIAHLWNVSSYCPGVYRVSSEDQTYPLLLKANKTFNITYRDWTKRTCTQVWGADCSVGPPDADNTFDACATGTGADESVMNIYVNATKVTAGSKVSVTCQFDPYSTADEDYIYYYNGTGWKAIYSGNSPGGNNYNRTVSATMDNVIGVHWFRCIIDYDGEGDNCANVGTWYDNDDINVSVWQAPSSCITFDVTAPTVKIIKPTGGVSFNLNAKVNITANVTDNTNVSTVKALIRYPSGASLNLTMSDPNKDKVYNASFTNTVVIGKYNVTIWANDTWANINSSQKTFFYVNDTIAPNWSSNKTSPASNVVYSPTRKYQFNVSWSDNYQLSRVKMEHNFTGVLMNYSVTGNASGRIFYYNYSALAAGRYVWRMYANDTSKNWNKSTQWIYVVQKAAPTIKLTLNSSEANITSEVYSIVKIVANLTTPAGKQITLYRNGTLINSGNSPLTNNTNFTSVGLFNITARYAGNQNYTSGSKTYYVNVKDTQKPRVKNPTPSAGAKYNTSNTVSLTANVSDNYLISSVKANVSWLTGSQLVTLLDPNVDKIYSGNFSSSKAGRYNVTIIANDTSGNRNASAKTYFILLAQPSVQTNKLSFIRSETVRIYGAGFNLNVKVTLNIRNSSGAFISGYPKNVTSNVTGGVSDSWVIPGGQNLGTYNVSAFDATAPARKANSSFDIVTAIVQGDKTYYAQGETVGISGYNWDAASKVTINITDPSLQSVYGPKNLTANGTGWIKDSWNISYGASIGSYIINAFEPSNPNKTDDFRFVVTQRPVSVSVNYSWYKRSDTVNVRGTGFKPADKVTVNITQGGSSVSGYPKNVTANASGSIKDSWSIPAGQSLGNYTVEATDFVYKNLQNSTWFTIVAQSVSTDKAGYKSGQTVYITGYYWDRSSKVTLSLKNSSGSSMTGYPKNVSASSDGQFADSWTAQPGSGFGTMTYNLSAAQAPQPAEKAYTTFDVIRTATLKTDRTEYDQKELVNITGNYYALSGDVKLLIKNTNNGNYVHMYPKTVRSNSAGSIQHSWNTSTWAAGTYLVTSEDQTYPALLYANTTFNIAFLKSNSSKETADASKITSVTGPAYKSGGSYPNTSASDLSIFYAGHDDPNTETQVYLELDFDISALGIPNLERIKNVEVYLDYCYSGGKLACDGTDAPDEATYGTQKIQAYNITSGTWYDIGDITIGSDNNEHIARWNLSSGFSDYLNSSRILKLRFESHAISYDDQYSDSYLIIDYAKLNVSYRSPTTKSYTAVLTSRLNMTAYNSSHLMSRNSTFTIINSTSGGVLDTDKGAYLRYLSRKSYDVRISTPVNGVVLTALIRGVNLSANKSAPIQVVEKYRGWLGRNMSNISSIFALDDSAFSFTNAQLWIPKSGDFNATLVAHCTQWSFLSSNCSSWEVNDTEEYGVQENSSHYWFNVTHFKAFGVGAGRPTPNITVIRIYDVTGLASNRSGGTLIGSGLNTTFNFYKRTWKLYRVEMDVRNDGSARWTIAAADTVRHQGLNSTWKVRTTDIWYVERGITHTGGTWSGGRVSWNMALGGRLNVGVTGTFYYVVNITTSTTKKYPVYFLANDTSVSSGSYDWSAYNITRVGYLEVNLTVPPKIPGQGNANSSNGMYQVGKGKLFMINATVYCRDGFCGNVNGSLRYNASSTLPNTRVSTTAAAKPFYVTSGTNPRVCSGNPLLQNGFCRLTWTVNSTGNLTSKWKMDVQFNSSKTVSNKTNYAGIQITLVLIMSLSWTQTGFGVCDPVTFGNPALRNNLKGYNVTLDPNSNDAGGLYIKGTDLVPRKIAGYGNVSYRIGVGNLTWNRVANNYTGSNTTRLSSAYKQVKSSMPAGSKVAMYYWINIPRGQFNQPYDGTMYLMVNKTQAY